jgi:ABC-2 type transport system permease protein
MKTLAFSIRNTKEIIRDKINLFFGIGFPIIIMLLLTFIQSHIPVEVFSISSLTPGIAVFGLSFISLFSGILVASDRGSSFLIRLFSSPMKPYEYISGYIIPLIFMSFLQCIVCYFTAIILGLEVNARILLAIIVLFPAIIFFICFGILMGSILNDNRQAECAEHYLLTLRHGYPEHGSALTFWGTQ